MATLDQNVVENLGRAAGVAYEDDEELNLVEKVKKRQNTKTMGTEPILVREDYQERNRRDCRLQSGFRQLRRLNAS